MQMDRIRDICGQMEALVRTRLARESAFQPRVDALRTQILSLGASLLLFVLVAFTNVRTGIRGGGGGGKPGEELRFWRA